METKVVFYESRDDFWRNLKNMWAVLTWIALYSL